MSRGNHNKRGTSGQGASNQSSQAFGEAADCGKSNHGEQTGGKRSIPEKKTASQSSHRNSSLDGRKNNR